MSVRRAALVVVAAVASAWVATSFASDLSGITGFDEFSENHQSIAKTLAATPSLARDPEYLDHHPSLKRYLHDNPLARAEFDEEEDQTPPPSTKGEEKEEDQHGKHYAHPDGYHKLMGAGGTPDE